MREELAFDGPSVIVARRTCIEALKTRRTEDGATMEKNIILAGVGGQGILSIAFVIDNAALDAGFEFKQAEVHGMAQRGGAVQSNLRYGDSRDLLRHHPQGRGRHGAQRRTPRGACATGTTSGPDGWVVTSVTPYVNIPDYPEHGAAPRRARRASPTSSWSTPRHIAKAAGNLRAQNMVAVGAASPLLDFTEDQLLAFRRGALRAQGREDRRGQPARLPLRPRRRSVLPRVWSTPGCRGSTALNLSAKIDPETIDPDHAGDLGRGHRPTTRPSSQRCWPKKDAVACDRAAVRLIA